VRDHFYEMVHASITDTSALATIKNGDQLGGTVTAQEQQKVLWLPEFDVLGLRCIALWGGEKIRVARKK